MNAHIRALQSQSYCDEVTAVSFRTNRKTLRSEPLDITPCEVSFAAFLRRQHPRDTVKAVVDRTGAHISTVEKWLQGTSMPSIRHLGVLIGAYGPSVVAAIYPNAPRWLDEAVLSERLRHLEEEHERRAAEIAELRRR